MQEADPRVPMPHYLPPEQCPNPPYMGQHPTTSYPQQPYPYPQHQMPMQQQYHGPPMHAEMGPNGYPRSPSRVAPNAATAQWMSQHYMNGMAGYAGSPAPSVTPSIMSNVHYLDDRMSMLSVNTNMTGLHHGVEDPSQRCFSSNGSTSENINPDMAFAQIAREAESILHNWPHIRDVQKRFEMSSKLLLWIKHNGLSQFNEHQFQEVVRRLLMIIVDGLMINGQPTRDVLEASYRLIEILGKLVVIDAALPIITHFFCMSSPNEPQLRDLLCPFINYQVDLKAIRYSHYIVDIILILLNQKDPESRKMCLKSIKSERMIYSLVKTISDPHSNVNSKILTLFTKLVFQDQKRKDMLIYQNKGEKQARPPQGNLIQKLFDNVLSKTINNVNASDTPLIVYRAFRLLRNLIYDQSLINWFVETGGIHRMCQVLQAIAMPSREALQKSMIAVREGVQIFLYISNEEIFSKVDIPLHFIMDLIMRAQDEDVFNVGTGFLSNIVANKPRYKRLAIQFNSIQLLDMIIFWYPGIIEIPAERRQKMRETTANCLRTLIHLLPFWANCEKNQIELNEQQQRGIFQTVQSLLSPEKLRKLLNLLVFDDGTINEATFEVRSYLLRLLVIVLKLPNIVRDGVLEVFDDVRKENIVGNALHVFTMARNLACLRANTNHEKDQKERMVDRSILLLQTLLTTMNDEVRRTIYNYFRHNSSSPLDIFHENTSESLIRVTLDFCASVAEIGGEVPPSWNVDRAMLEGMTNSRNSDIAASAQNLLRRIPVNSHEPLADLFASNDYNFY